MNYTLEQLQQRHSVRSYSESPLSKRDVDLLNAEITAVNTAEAGMKFQLITDDSDPFAGVSKSYGFFRNPRNYIACVADTSFANWRERVGFCAQQIVMAATCAGIATCFVGGTFDRKSVKARIRVGEELPFIILCGYPSEKKDTLITRMAMKMAHRKKIDWREFYDTSADLCLDEALKIMPHLKAGLLAAACAPSSLNKRPARFRVECWVDSPDSAFGAYSVDEKAPQPIYKIQALVDESNPKNLSDLGIAMFNFCAAFPGSWEWGNPAEFFPYDE